MRLTCPNCGAQYEVPEDVIPVEGRDVKCSNCDHIWHHKWDDLQGQSNQGVQQFTQPSLDPGAADIQREEATTALEEAKNEVVPQEEVSPLAERSSAEDPHDRSDQGEIERVHQVGDDEVQGVGNFSPSSAAGYQEIHGGKTVAQLSYEQVFPSVPPKRISQIKKLVEANPVHLEEHDGRLGLANNGSPERVSPTEMANLIAALKSHVEQLLFECGQKQVPEDFKRRLENYLVPLSQDVPIFLMLDAPMAFIQGSINDNYVTEALDGGFLEACRLLVRMHEQLRPLLVSAEQSEKIVPDLLPDIGEQEALEIADSAIEELDDPSVEHEVIEALKAAKDYFEIAQQGGSSRLSLLRRGIAAIGGIVSGAVAGACGTALYVWATSPSGVAVIARLQPVLERLLSLFL